MSGVTGVPDRICLLPGGIVHFVELKKEGGVVSKRQEIVIKIMLELGMSVQVVTGMVGVDNFLERIDGTTQVHRAEAK